MVSFMVLPGTMAFRVVAFRGLFSLRISVVSFVRTGWLVICSYGSWFRSVVVWWLVMIGTPNTW